MIEKALWAGTHCGEVEICRKSGPPQAENPVLQDSLCNIKFILLHENSPNACT